MMLLAQTDFYYANRGMGWGFDGTYVLIILAFLISALVSAKMNATFSKYSKVRSYCGMTGAQAAQRILSSAGIYDVRIEHVSGKLTDHYDPSNKVLRLMQSMEILPLRQSGLQLMSVVMQYSTQEIMFRCLFVRQLYQLRILVHSYPGRYF